MPRQRTRIVLTVAFLTLAALGMSGVLFGPTNLALAIIYAPILSHQVLQVIEAIWEDPPARNPEPPRTP